MIMNFKTIRREGKKLILLDQTVLPEKLVYNEYSHYRDVIPAGKKDGGEASTDHMGIVLSVDDEGFEAAEGNNNNENMSGVVKRAHHKNVEGFISIPDDYEYDGWKYDYKTGKVHIVPFLSPK